jgi:hypothetical protein
MPRAISVADPAHREEQREYRDGLVTKGEPEIGRADTAVAVAVYGLLREISSKDRGHGRRSLVQFLEKAATVLEAQGYDRERALRVLRRRLVRPPERFDTLLGLKGDDGDAHYEIIP